MKKTIGCMGIGMVMAFTLIGCSRQLEEVTAIIQQETRSEDSVLDDISQEDVPSARVALEDLILFFEGYFSLSLQDRLVLNQDSMMLEAEEKQVYQETLDSYSLRLTPFLSEGALGRFEKGYIKESFHLPKLLEINHYITEETMQVEDVQIVSARPLGDRMIYQVDVTTTEKVVDLIEANRKYVWDISKQYYGYKEHINNGEIAFKSGYNLEEALKESYLFLQVSGEVEDAIRLIHSYWVEVIPGEILQIESIQEANGYTTSQENRQAANYNKHVTRLPFEDQVSDSNRQAIEQALTNVFSKPRDFYSYYEKAWQQGYEKLEEVLLEELEISKWGVLTVIGYQDAFHPHINPYKDNIQHITFQKEQISIMPSWYGTQKQPRYQVQIPAKVLKNINEQVECVYEYMIGFEQNKIEYIQFIGIKQ